MFDRRFLVRNVEGRCYLISGVKLNTVALNLLPPKYSILSFSAHYAIDLHTVQHAKLYKILLPFKTYLTIIIMN